MRRMGVPPLTTEFMEIQSKIDEVTEFAHDLWERHVRDDEMPPNVINVSRVNLLVGAVLGGGVLRFRPRRLREAASPAMSPSWSWERQAPISALVFPSPKNLKTRKWIHDHRLQYVRDEGRLARRAVAPHQR
jgi:hypothetical protein